MLDVSQLSDLQVAPQEVAGIAQSLLSLYEIGQVNDVIPRDPDGPRGEERM